MSQKPLQFKRLDAATAAAPQPQNTSKEQLHVLVKEGFPVHKWAAGRNIMRFIPQASGEWFTELWSVGFPKTSGIRGNLRITDAGFDGELFKVKKLLREHQDYGQYLYHPEHNPNGLNLTARPKIGFLAIDLAERPARIKAVVLPATVPWARKDGQERRAGAGSRIVSFVGELNIKGQPKWGNISDLIDGRAVIIDVANPGTLQAEYSPSVDEQIPLAKLTDVGDMVALPEYAALLENGTPDFSTVFPEPPADALAATLKRVLPFEAWDYLSVSLGWGETAKMTAAEPQLPRSTAFQFEVPKDDAAPTAEEVATFAALQAKMKGAGLKI